MIKKTGEKIVITYGALTRLGAKELLALIDKHDEIYIMSTKFKEPLKLVKAKLG